MRPTIEAEVDREGTIRPKKPVTLAPGSKLLITVVEQPSVSETALQSEASLPADWDCPEGDAAWAYLSLA
jgi:protein involved in polysaccharide export with SLBB domain